MADDLFEGGPEARDAALEKVSGNNKTWMRDALRMMRTLPAGELGTAEDIGRRLRWQGLPHPSDPGAWGALTMQAIQKRIIVNTGKRRQMKGRKAHARSTAVYRKA
ncbi:MAG TPA: hypothetical protein VGJ79_00625 [Candidatus Dormibacteraeota bacterium]|jgi:hypothetical protein